MANFIYIKADSTYSTTKVINYGDVQSILPSTDVLVSSVQSVIGGESIYFNGSSSKVTSLNSTLPYFPVNGDFTIQFWMYNLSANDGLYHYILTIAEPAGIGFRFGDAGLGNRLQFSTNFSDTNIIKTTPITKASCQNTWMHVALVRSVNELKLYINGTLQVWDTFTGTNYVNTSYSDARAVTGNFTLGSTFNNLYYLNGYLDDVLVTDVALYNADFTPPSAPSIPYTVNNYDNLIFQKSANLSMYHKFDDSTDITKAYDASGNGRNLTLNSMTYEFDALVTDTNYSLKSVASNASKAYYTGWNINSNITSGTLSYEGWFRIDSLPTTNHKPIFGWTAYDNTSADFSHGVYVDTDGRISWYMFGANSSANYIYGRPITLGQPFHVVVVSKGVLGHELYQDGILVGTNSYSGGLYNFPYDDFGINGVGGSSYTGQVLYADNIAVYDTQLTAQEIEDRYIAGGGVLSTDTYDDLVYSAGSNLYAYYKFDEPTNSTNIFDYSGNNRSMTISGAFTRLDGLLDSRPSDKSLNLNQSTGYASVSGININQFVTTGFTMEFWIEFNTLSLSSGQLYTLVTTWPSVGGSGLYTGIYLTSNYKFNFQTWDGSNGYPITGGPSVAINQKYHVTAVTDNTGRRLYVNGMLWASSANVVAGTVAQYLMINGTNGGGQLRGDFKIDNLAIYSKALTEQEITDRYYDGIGGDPYVNHEYYQQILSLNPEGYWPCDEPSGILIDRSGNNHHAYPYDHGAVTYLQEGIVPDGNGVPSSSIHLDQSVTSQAWLVGYAPINGDAPFPANPPGMAHEFWFRFDEDTSVAFSRGMSARPLSQTGTRLFETAFVTDAAKNSYTNFYPSNGTGAGYYGYQTPRKGQWHHVVTTYDLIGGYFKTYIDGVMVQSRSVATATMMDEQYYLILGNSWNLTGCISGRIQHIAHYRRELTESEVLANYLKGIEQRVGTIGSPLPHLPVNITNYPTLTPYMQSVLNDNPVMFMPLGLDDGVVNVYDLCGRSIGEWQNGKVLGPSLVAGENVPSASFDRALNATARTIFVKDSPASHAGDECTIEMLFKNDFANVNVTSQLYCLNRYDDTDAWETLIKTNSDEVELYFGGVYYGKTTSAPFFRAYDTIFHLGITWSRIQRISRVYLNGHFIGQLSTATNPVFWDGDSSNVIGLRIATRPGSTQDFTGYIQHLAKYDYAFSDAQAKEKFRKRFLLSHGIPEVENNAYRLAVLADSPSLFIPFNEETETGYPAFYIWKETGWPTLHQPEILRRNTNYYTSTDNITVGQNAIMLGGDRCWYFGSTSTAFLAQDSNFAPGHYSFIGDMSLECWVNLSSVSSIGGIYPGAVLFGAGAVGVSVSTDIPWRIYITPTWQIAWINEYGGENVSYFTTNANVISPNTTHHIVVTRSGNTVTIYVDGISVKSATVTNPSVIPTDTKLNIGYNGANDGIQSFVGYIQCFALYESALTLTQIRNHYSLGSGINVFDTTDTYAQHILSQSNLVGYYRHNEISGSKILMDSSPLENHGVYYGNATLEIPGVISGNNSYITENNTSNYPAVKTQTITANGDWTWQGWAYFPSSVTQDITAFKLEIYATVTDPYPAFRIEIYPIPNTSDRTFYLFANKANPDYTGDRTGASGIALGNFINKGGWNHVAVTRDYSNLLHIFINGRNIVNTNQLANTPLEYAPTGVGGTVIDYIRWGAYYNTTSTSVVTNQCGADEVSVYNTWLTQEQIVNSRAIALGENPDSYANRLNKILGRYGYSYEFYLDNSNTCIDSTTFVGTRIATYAGVIPFSGAPLHSASTGSLYFDGGSTSYISGTNITSGNRLDFLVPTITNEMIIEAWVQFESKQNAVIVNEGGSTDGIELGVFNNELGIFIREGGTLKKCVTSLNNIRTGMPVHIIAQVNSSVLRLYINGKLVSTNVVSIGGHDGTGPFNIGGSDGVNATPASGVATKRQFVGYIDSIYIYCPNLLNYSFIMDEAKATQHYLAGSLQSSYQQVIDTLQPTLYLKFDTSPGDNNLPGQWIDQINAKAFNIHTTAAVSTPTVDTTGYVEQSFSVEAVMADNVQTSGSGGCSYYLSGLTGLNVRYDFTTCFWIKVKSSGSNRENPIINIQYDFFNGVNGPKFYNPVNLRAPYTASTNTFKLKHQQKDGGSSASSGWGAVSTTANSWSADEWHHVALIREWDQASSITTRMFVDGVEVSLTGTVVTPMTTTQYARYHLLGEYADQYSSSFYSGNSTIDEYMHFNRVLTAQEISDLYNATGTEYRVYGTVTQDNVPVQRKVRIYRRSDGKFIKEIQSDPTTGLYEIRWRELYPDVAYYAIAFDDDVAPNLNAIIQDRMTPEAI